MGEFSAGAERSGFSVVVAMDRNRGIGNKGDLPWPKLKGDMKFFRELTTCPDRAAVEKRWGLKAEESSDVQNWEDMSARLKLGVHPLPPASDEKRNAVIMGRKTWESLPDSYRPLSQRYNHVMTRNKTYPMHVNDPNAETLVRYITLTGNISAAIAARGSSSQTLLARSANLYVIGGGQVFSEVVVSVDCVHLYITEIDTTFECDTHFPETPDFHPVLSSPWIEENGIRYRFRRYDRT